MSAWRISIRRVTVGALLLAAAPLAAQAQDRRLATRLDAATAATVERLADSLRAAGLPAEPVIAVALEGATRGAPADRILAAVRDYAAALGEARRALGAARGSDELSSAAGVIVAGVPAGVLASWREARADAPLTVPLVVLADLVARGAPRDSAASALGDALWRGAGDAALLDLRRRVERDITGGAPPMRALARRLGALPFAGGFGRGRRAPPPQSAPRPRGPRIP